MKPPTASHFAFLQIPSLALMALAVAFNPGSASAQGPSQGPAIIRVPTPVPSLDSNALGYGANGIVEHVFFTKDLMSRGPNRYYGFSEGRDNRTAPLRAGAFWYDAATQAVTLVPDLAPIRSSSDLGPVCDPGLTVLTTWTASGGGGIRYSTRNAPTGPWGPLAPVTGIWSRSFTATPCWSQGKLHLMWDDERNNLSIGEFNATNGAVTNARTLVTNPATGPSFFCHSPTPQNDDQGEMRGLAFIVRQRGTFNSSAICTTYRLDDKGPNKVWEDTALYQPGGYIGGSFYSARLPLAGPGSATTIRLDLGNTACASIPTAGGKASLFLWAPQKNPSAPPWAAVLMLGLAGSGFEVPGVNGKIYIEPATLTFLPFLGLPPTTGFGRYDLTTPPVEPRFLAALQPVYVDQSGATFVGNLATVTSH